MAKLRYIDIANICPHCASKNIETEPQWKNLDAHTPDKHDHCIRVSLDYEGEHYYLHFFKCKVCKTSFCIKRLDTQMY